MEKLFFLPTTFSLPTPTTHTNTHTHDPRPLPTTHDIFSDTRQTQIPLLSRKKSQFDISQQLTAYFIMTGTEKLEGLKLIECFRFWDEDQEKEDEIFSVLSSALREPASFWQENVTAVVILRRVLARVSL